jgi:hypothetical protein
MGSTSQPPQSSPTSTPTKSGSSTGHEQPLTIPSLTVVGSGLRYSYANGNRSPMPLTDVYLLQGGRPSHLPIIAALPTVFGRQCIGDMIPLPMMEMIGDQVFNYALSLFSLLINKHQEHTLPQDLESILLYFRNGQALASLPHRTYLLQLQLSFCS